MTKPKLKFTKDAYLYLSQVIEVMSAESDSERAKELCDSINVSIEWLKDMGFDPLAVYERRVDEKAPIFKSIIRRYDDKLQPILDEVKKEGE